MYSINYFVRTVLTIRMSMSGLVLEEHVPVGTQQQVIPFSP